MPSARHQAAPRPRRAPPTLRFSTPGRSAKRGAEASDAFAGASHPAAAAGARAARRNHFIRRINRPRTGRRHRGAARWVIADDGAADRRAAGIQMPTRAAPERLGDATRPGDDVSASACCRLVASSATSGAKSPSASAYHRSTGERADAPAQSSESWLGTAASAGDGRAVCRRRHGAGEPQSASSGRRTRRSARHFTRRISATRLDRYSRASSTHRAGISRRRRLMLRNCAAAWRAPIAMASCRGAGATEIVARRYGGLEGYEAHSALSRQSAMAGAPAPIRDCLAMRL